MRWNDFESSISGSLREIRDAKDFFDVTLVCDEEQVQAHKVIISACSPFFRSILQKNPHQHPLLYLKGVKFTELNSVLNFMYHGEANIAQDDLNSFLAVAEELKVKGLTQNQSESGTSSSNREPSKPISRDIPPPPKRAKVQYNTNTRANVDDDIQEVVPVKSEPGTLAQKQDYYDVTTDQNQLAEYGDESYDNYEDYETDQNYGVAVAATGQEYDKGKPYFLYVSHTGCPK